MKQSKQQGQILISLLIVVPALMLIVSSYLSLSISSLRLSRQDQLRTHSQLAADAGVDYAVEQVNINNGWAGTSDEVTLHSDGHFKTTYIVSVVSNSSSSKTITSTGRAFWPAGATAAGASVTLKVDLRAVSSGSYSVVSGEGGLQMNNSSKITGGDVYINGTISLSNTAQIGLSTNPVTVEVADEVCPVPPDSTYPRICTAADNPAQPITFQNTPWIYGSVKANNQTDGSHMSMSGLVSSSGVAAAALPTYDRNSQKAAVSTTLSSGFSCSSGTQTWLANTKIVGNATISGTCKVTVQGNIWITGALTVSNSAQLIAANSLGTTRSNIMIDGLSGATFRNSSQMISNTSGTGFQVITFYSTASCSPDCSSVTGTDLNNSRGVTTIILDNSAQGPQTVFYAYWSKVVIRNSGQIGSLIGQTISLQNTGTITFTSSTGVGNTSWVINGYRRTF